MSTKGRNKLNFTHFNGTIQVIGVVAVLLGTGLGPTGAGAQTPVSASVGTPSSVIGKPIKPTARASSDAAVVRTAEDARRFVTAKPTRDARYPAHRPGIPMGEPAYQTLKQSAAQAPLIKKRPATNIGPYVAPSTIIRSFPGPSESDAGNGFYPPDSNGAIGGNYIVAPVNLTYNVYNRNGVALLHTSFNALFNTSEELSDPRVIYDPIWKRWVVSLITVPTSTANPPACFWLAISTSANATGPWYIYHPCVSGGFFANGDLWDYDILGMTQDAVLLTGNIFACCFTTYKGAVATAIPKAKLYNGLGFGANIFPVPTSVGTLTPPIVQDSNANAYFIAADSSGTFLDLYRGTNLSNEGQFSFALQAQISASFSVPPHARQPNTTQVLDTLDGRFQAPSAQYGNSLWNVHTQALGSFPAPKFFQLDTSSNTIFQSGFFFESSTSDDFNPSIAANSNDEAFVTWSATNATGGAGVIHNARVRFSGRQGGDTAGVIGAGSSLILSPRHLTGNLQNGVQRWGDYSSVFLDSSFNTSCGSANRRAAIFNERIIDENTWGTEIGIIGFC